MRVLNMDLGGKYATALQAASVGENTGGDILKLLLEGGADPIALGLYFRILSCISDQEK
jgi:hypothetical protein